MKIEASHLGYFGIFLLGTAALITSLLFAHFYYQVQASWISSSSSGDGGFSAYCSKKVVIITAFEDMKDVSISNKNQETVCSFREIKDGNEEICDVNTTGIFVVSSGLIKKTVPCEAY